MHLQMKDPAEAERIFHALAEDGTVKMPIQQTFWARPFWHACRSIRHTLDGSL